MAEKRARVLRPENNEARILIGHVGFLPIEGIGPNGITSFEAFEEPVGVKGGNVGTPACGNDHRENRLGKIAIIQPDGSIFLFCRHGFFLSGGAIYLEVAMPVLLVPMTASLSGSAGLVHLILEFVQIS